MVTPVLEKPDEEDHYGYVRYLREHHHLPTLSPHEKWLFESKQPPLYYALVALVTAPLKDVADPDVLIVSNPYLDYSVPGYREDNRNAYLHPPSMTGVIFAGRCISLLFGAGTLLSAYMLARLIVPHSAFFPLAVAAVVGFQPMFLFIATSLSNDALAAFFATLTVTLLFYRLRYADFRHFSLIVGGVLGLAALTKVSALVFCPLVGLSLLLIRQRVDKRFVKELAFIGLVAFAIGGWWYVRNALEYGDPFTLNAHLSPTTQLRPLATYFGQDLRDIERTFWGNLARVFVSSTWLDRAALWWGRISSIVALLAAFRHRRYILQRWRELVLLTLWPVTFGVLLLGFWTRQANWAWGRFLLPSAGPLMVLLMLGWSGLLRGRRQTWGFLGVAGSMVMIGVLSPWLTIRPLYHPYRPVKTLEYPVNLVLRDAASRPIATLLGYNLPQPYTTPGRYTPVEICWEALGVTGKPLTELVQWLDLGPVQEGRLPGIVAGRNTYPGLGNLPTDRWPLGKRFCDWVLVEVSDAVSVPVGTALEIGLWDPETGERLQYSTPEGQPVGWTIFKGVAIVDEKATSSPQAETGHYVFDGQIHLLSLTHTSAEDQLVITTTWTVTYNPAYDAVLFVHAQDAQGHLIAQTDHQPLDGRYPTSYWYPGTVVTDTLILDVPHNTIPATLVLGMYTLPDVLRLPLVDPNGTSVPDNALHFAP